MKMGETLHLLNDPPLPLSLLFLPPFPFFIRTAASFLFKGEKASSFHPPAASTQLFSLMSPGCPFGKGWRGEERGRRAFYKPSIQNGGSPTKGIPAAKKKLFPLFSVYPLLLLLRRVCYLRKGKKKERQSLSLLLLLLPPTYSVLPICWKKEAN